MLDAFRRGLSEDAALRQFDIDVLGRLGLLNAWAESMDEMRRREANGVVDVAAANLMEEACRRYPAFLTMNHPSALLLADYLQTVFAFAGIGYRPINALKLRDPLAEHDTTPILDEVAEHLHLPYRVSQRWKINAMGGRFVSREDFIAECYEIYRRIEPRRLVANSPTDLVLALGADPDLTYLVDPVAPCPRVAPAVASSGAEEAVVSIAAPDVALKMIRREVERAIRPMENTVEEIRRYTHKVHSHTETAGPKVQHLVHVTSLLLRSAEQIRQAQVIEAADRLARRLSRLTRWIARTVRRLRLGMSGHRPPPA